MCDYAITTASRTPVSDAYAAAHETNPLDYRHEDVDWSNGKVPLADVDKVIRIRLLTDSSAPVYDVSYVHGMKDGKIVPVDADDLGQIRKVRFGGPSIYRQLVAWAKGQGVYAKGKGLLDASVISYLD